MKASVIRIAAAITFLMAATALRPASATDLEIFLQEVQALTGLDLRSEFGIDVRNTSNTGGGPFDSPNTQVSGQIPAQLRLIDLVPSQGGCEISGQSFFCDLGTLPAGSTASIDAVVEGASPGTGTISVNVSGGLFDPDPGNNSDSADMTVGFVEVDDFEQTAALIQLTGGPFGSIVESFILRGPATVNVQFEGAEGDAEDDDDDGRDEVQTELVQLDLTDGTISLSLNADETSSGEIEEQQNNIPGTLDLPPFGAPGTKADSFFDVFFEIDTGQMVLHNGSAFRIESVISEKPPYDRYFHVIPEDGPVELLTAANQPSGIFIVEAEHSTSPLEIDIFEASIATITLITPSGASETIELSGPSTAHVYFEGPDEGDADDNDGNGREEVETELVELDLTGTGSMGPVSVTLNEDLTSTGIIEETLNSTNGVLDIPPFTVSGTADSFFDVFFEVEVGGQTLHTAEPKRMSATITNKPPGVGDTYENPEIIALLDANNAESGYSIGNASHVPNPPPPDFTEIDAFEQTTALVQLQGAPIGGLQSYILTGPSTVHVFFEGPEEGIADDDDDDGREEVQTELVELNLTGDGVSLRLQSDESSTGEIEETQNNTAGILDLPPFTDSGTADSFFDVFFDIEVGSQTLHNGEALRIESLISEKPPYDRYFHLIPPGGPIELLDPSGNPTGVFIVEAEHVTGPIEIDAFPDSRAKITLNAPDGQSETVFLTGPTTVNVFFEGPEEGDADDNDGDGREEVETEMVELDLTGQSSFGPVVVRLNPDEDSVGEIEENQNSTSGTLDLPPFSGTGSADSFFDVFFEVEVAGMVLHTEEPKRMTSTIRNKPPGPGEWYENPDIIPLLDPNGQPTGFTIGNTRHIPDPGPIERDGFEETTALVLLEGAPIGGRQAFILRGPSTVDVFFEGAAEGDAEDDDEDGLDEVDTELIELNLTDGTATLGLQSDRPSLGEIEENQNSRPGTLDLPPFGSGTADSFFDVFFELSVGGLTLLNDEALRIEAVISHKPPTDRYFHIIPEDGPLELLDPQGNPTGVFIIEAEHYTGHVEIDAFDESAAELELITPQNETLLLTATGPTRVNVYFEQEEGEAEDDDDDGRDEVETEMVELTLTGESPMGAFEVRLNPEIASLGEIEETNNANSGTLDIPPFTATGTAESFFDVFFELEVGGQVLRTNEPKRMTATISNKPPGPGEEYQSPVRIPLLNPDGSESGYAIGRAGHTPDPEPDSTTQERDEFARTTALFQIQGGPFGDFPVPITATGPAVAVVDFEGDAEGDADDDDGNGREEVQTELVSLDLTGSSPVGPVSVTLQSRASTGEMEERENATPGTLDVRPFTDDGTVDSFFDVFFEIATEQASFHNQDALRIEAAIQEKPPFAEYIHLLPDDPLELFDVNAQPAGVYIVRALHFTGWMHETERPDESEIGLWLAGPDGVDLITLAGPSRTGYFFEGSEPGLARDDDGNQLDDIRGEMIDLRWRGDSDKYGLVDIRLDTRRRSTGIVEERENATPGFLDATSGSPATAVFDVWIQASIGGDGLQKQEHILHNEDALQLSVDLTSVEDTSAYTMTSPISLVDEQGNPSDFTMQVSPVAIEPDGPAEAIPGEFRLERNYPNPFRAETVIPFVLPEINHVTLEVYDALGRQVAVLVDRVLPAGAHEVTWDAAAVPSGIYLIRMKAGDAEIVRQATVLK